MNRYKQNKNDSTASPKRLEEMHYKMPKSTRIDDIDAQSAAKSHQPERTKDYHKHSQKYHGRIDASGSTSNVDLERDSRQILDSDGLKSSHPSDIHPSAYNSSSNIALSNVKSVQLQRMVLLSQQQLKEIRSYTANEIFKTRKLTNKLYKEFEQVKQMREDIRSTQYQVGNFKIDDFNSNSMEEQIRKKTAVMEK